MAATTLVVGLAGLVMAFAPLAPTGSPLEGIVTAAVRRVDLEGQVLAPGHVESTNRTEITCSLEQLAGTGSGSGNVGGASTILHLIPEGSTVKKGEVLCELDASAYAELVRSQEINVQRARSDYQQAALACEVAKIQLQSYQEGDRKLTEQQYRSQIALAQSDLTRQKDRVTWTKRMLEKGYAAAAQVATEQQTLTRLVVSHEQLALAFENYERFSVAKDLLTFQTQIVGAESTLSYQKTKLKREEERLAHYQRLVNGCTVHSPHDGLVVYANRPGRQQQVYEGAPVRERMRLFYLPDLTQMEVQVMLHETIVKRVGPEMPARIVVDAIPGHPMKGTVTSIAQLPYMERRNETGNDVTYFVGHIRLDTIAPGLRPGMSAEVTIATGPRKGVLAVPPGGVTVKDHRHFCTVVRGGRLEQHAVTVGQATPQWMEVAEGLSEGDRVVIAVKPSDSTRSRMGRLWSRLVGGSGS